ncbi:MAG: DUF3471 domain-containing protein, partial [Clostridia bacterium]|nr:DUF3471 domain-containing protein [Clostridia bacterium]
TTAVNGLRRADNRALPYGRKDGKPVLERYNDFDGMAGCGCVNSTLEDMLKLTMFYIGKGEYRGRRLVSEKVMDEIYAPRNVIPPQPHAFQPEAPMGAYAFGWVVQPFRGHMCLQHSGGIDGFSSYLTFMPIEGIGIVVFANEEGTSFHRAVAAAAYDLILGVDAEKDWPSAYAAVDRALMYSQEKENGKVRASIRPDSVPTRPLKDYTGCYAHPGYGALTVTLKNGRLAVRYNGRTWPLEHSNYDSFYVAYDEDAIERLAPFTFQWHADGGACLMAKMEPALEEDICFVKDHT